MSDLQPRPPVQKWGVVITRLATVRDIPVELTSDQLMRIVRLFQPYREGSVQVQLEEHEIAWRDREGLRFAMSSIEGSTVLRVQVSRFLLRRRRWMGIVKAAADRLETLSMLVARQDHATRAFPPARPPRSGVRPPEPVGP
ncbi:MAG: hypothetical protein R3E10_13460 [Gemmatimonadota bacterium]